MNILVAGVKNSKDIPDKIGGKPCIPLKKEDAS